MSAASEPSVFTQEILVKAKDRYASMSVRVWKPAGQPRASVFCLHEFTGNGRDFDALATLLCRNGYQIVCPDMIGRGRSAFLAGSAPYDIELYNRSLRTLAEFGSRTNHYLGASWGATTMLLAWAVAPWKIGKLVLVDPPLIGSAALDAMRDRIVADGARTFATRAEAEAHVLATAGLGAGIDPEVARGFAQHRVAEKDGSVRLAFDPAAAARFAELRGQAYDLFPVVAKIDAPVLLMQAQDNPLLDRAAIDRYRASHRDRFAMETVPGSPSALLRIDQQLAVLGFLDAA